MKNPLIRVLSFCKLILLAIFHIIIFPVYFFLPKYENYIFVLTTGRSGSGALSNSFENSTYINSFHEPYPIMNNNFLFNKKILSLWNWFVFYFVKYPNILLSCKKRNKIYLETNHLFLKSFATYAIKAFGNKLRIIHLIREPEKVAKSMYEIDKIPGTNIGNIWYLNPYDKSNNLNYREIINSINKNNDVNSEDFYKCAWYWFEMENRIQQFKLDYPNIPVVTIKTEELNDLNLVIEKMNIGFGLHIPKHKLISRTEKVAKNLKTDEKIKNIELEKAKEKTVIFQNTLNRI